MQHALPTVQIQDGKGGYLIINARDLDPKKHKLYAPESDAPDDENDDLTAIKGIGGATAAKLAQAGITTYEQLAGAVAADVAGLVRGDEATVQGWQAEARARALAGQAG